MKKLLGVAVIFIFLMVASVITVSAENNIMVYVEGEELESDVPPTAIDGRIMVPMRAIFEELGATVEWDQETKTITGKKGETVVIMHLDDKNVLVDGVEKILDVAPTSFDGRTLVPVRAVSEGLGINVNWYGDIATVAIYENKGDIEYEKLYNLKGKEVYIDSNFKEQYKDLGWEKKQQNVQKVCLYHPDGRIILEYIGNVEQQIANGWYKEPVKTMYAADGRTIVVTNAEVEAYKKVGWQIEPIVTMYALDGRTQQVLKSEVEANKKVGWYESREAVEKAIQAEKNRNKKVPDSMKRKLFEIVKKEISKQLRSPSNAIWPDYTEAKYAYNDEGQIIVSGYLEAMNGFGGYNKETYIFVFNEDLSIARQFI